MINEVSQVQENSTSIERRRNISTCLTFCREPRVYLGLAGSSAVARRRYNFTDSAGLMHEIGHGWDLIFPRNAHRRGRGHRGGPEVTATGGERVAENEDKGSRRRPAGPEVHLRYHLPVFSSALCLYPCICKCQDAALSLRFIRGVRYSNCANRRARSTDPRFQGGAATIHLPGYPR